ncbi:MAG TPA: DUF6174 domain-containing protein [Gemmataceae bacterium]|nr:DUF6174 domain-containing protein [Gemmataceae bacterium]
MDIGHRTSDIGQKRANWIWYFIGIAMIAVFLLGILIFFIQNQLAPEKQLSIEQLNTARKLWVEKGPKDYQLLYTVQRGTDKGKDLFFVEVRGGKVQSVILNGNERLPADKLDYSSMEGLFKDIEMFLKHDAQPTDKKTFCRGYFDREDGHLVEFVRRVEGSTERVGIKVEEFKPLAGK